MPVTGTVPKSRSVRRDCAETLETEDADNRDRTAAMSTLDYPLIRATAKCPLCTARKPTGNLVCWPCFRALGFRHGVNAVHARRLDDAERILESK